MNIDHSLLILIDGNMFNLSSIQTISQEDTSISLPPSLFNNQNISLDHPNIGIAFGNYYIATLFPVGEERAGSIGGKQTQVGSNIVSAIVGRGIEFEKLLEPVTTRFRLQISQGKVSRISIKLSIIISSVTFRSHNCFNNYSIIIITLILYNNSTWHQALRNAFHGILILKTGHQKDASQASAKMEL